MKRLVLCFDGTWNAVADPKTVTNVVRLANLVTVSSQGIDQITYYNSGVGSGGPVDRLLGGAFGVGLKSNVKRGLTFLALNYEAGDEIYLFGFSRGAYTARALSGVVGAAGIPLDISQTETHWQLYQKLAELRPKQRKLQLKGESPALAALDAQMAEIRSKITKLSRNEDEQVPITCVGVFDTVGAYGIPSGFGGLSALSHALTNWTRGFRDTQIGNAVKLGLHAVAVDEMRRPFLPTFWTVPHGRQLQAQEVEQMWFAGVHSNVGGGYDNCGLSDLALAWMIARVSEKTGLKFNEEEALATVWPCSACTLYSTSRGWPFGIRREILPVVSSTFLARTWRAIKKLLGMGRRVELDRINEQVHWSVEERCGWPESLVDGRKPGKYAPPNLAEGQKPISTKLELERLLSDRDYVPAAGKDYSEIPDLDERLAARNKAWDDHCSSIQSGLPCRCKARAAARGTSTPNDQASAAA
jgi:hypothetical protein